MNKTLSTFSHFHLLM